MTSVITEQSSASTISNPMMKGEMESMMEFQNQLKSLMMDLKEGMRELQSEIKNRAVSPSQRIVGLVAQLDKTNNRFFEAASRAQTAPQISLYDGTERKAILRASAEATRDTASSGGYGERGVIVSRLGSANDLKKPSSMNESFATSAPTKPKAAVVVAKGSNDEENVVDGESIVPDDGFPTPSKVVYNMKGRGEAEKKRTKGLPNTIAPYLSALYAPSDRPSSNKSGVELENVQQRESEAATTSAAKAIFAGVGVNASLPDVVVKTGKKSTVTKGGVDGTSTSSSSATKRKKKGIDEESRMTQTMERYNPTMAVLLKRTANMVDDARKKAGGDGKKKEKRATAKKTIDDNHYGDSFHQQSSNSATASTDWQQQQNANDSFRVNNIGTIHEETDNTDEHDYYEEAAYLNDEGWESVPLTAAGGGGGNNANGGFSRPTSRQLHSSGGRLNSSGNSLNVSSANGSNRSISPASRENKQRRATYDTTQQKHIRTDSSTSSSSSRQRPNSRPNSRPTITDLFALSPEQVVKQQQKLKDIGWTQQRVNETTNDENDFDDRNEGTESGDDQTHTHSNLNKNHRNKLKKVSAGDHEGKATEGEGEAAFETTEKEEVPSGAYTTLEWQNELARHILSMYASTTAVNHLEESKAILEFVDTKRSGTVETVSHELFAGGGPGEISFDSIVKDEIAEKKREKAKAKARLLGKSTTGGSGNDSGKNSGKREGGMSPNSPGTPGLGLPLKTSKAPKFPKSTVVSKSATAIPSHKVTRPEPLPSRVPLPGDALLVRAHDGAPVAARPMGPPKCYPVWFVGTGDIYSDWSAISVSKIIDGVKLQAQLQVMSEHREFWEYLGVVEAVINKYYKDVIEREKQAVEDQKQKESQIAQIAFAQALNSRSSRSPSPDSSGKRGRSPNRSMDLHSAQNDQHHQYEKEADVYDNDQRPSTKEQSRGTSRGISSGGHASASSGDSSRSQSHSRGGSVHSSHSHRSPSPGSMLYPTKQPSSKVMYGRPGSNGEIMDFGVNTEEWGANDFFLDQGDDQPIAEEATGMLGADNPSQDTIDNDPTRSDRINIGVFWLQLISTGAAMATLSIEDKRYDLAMNILQRLERWCTREDLLSHRQRMVGRAITLDAFAYYFFRRHKFHASLRHTNLARVLHDKLKNHDGAGAGLLQVAIVECFQGKFKACHKTLYQFLAMIEDGRLAFQAATPRQLCLVAVGYHNLAVVQLKMQHSDLAAKSSQNARKIARLCLSCSTRYLAVFQMTHEAAAKDLGFHMKFRPGAAGFGNELEDASDSTLLAVNRMTEDFFKTVPDIENEAWSNIGDPNQGKTETARLPTLVNKIRAY